MGDSTPCIKQGTVVTRGPLSALCLGEARPSLGEVRLDNTEDVTDPERLPLESFKKNTEFTRQHLLDVLARAGERLGNELLYARSAGR